MTAKKNIFSIPSDKSLNYSDITKYLENNYNNWRECQKDSVQPFYLLNSEFKHYLPYLTTGALKLYLFYCFNAKNFNGESWYARDSIAKEFKTTPRSIDQWNGQLINLNLIYRGPNNKSSTSTFVLPISDYFINIPNLNIEEYMKTVNEEIDGKLIGCMHLFQWRKKSTRKTPVVYNEPFHQLVLIFEKKINDKITKKKFIVFANDELNSYKIDFSARKFKDNIYKFESIFFNKLLQKHNIPIQGIAINPTFNLVEQKEKTETLFKVLKECGEQFNNIEKNGSIKKVNLLKLKGSDDK